MTLKMFATGAAALCLATSALAQTTAPQASARAAAQAQGSALEFSPERFRAHVGFLANDLLEGREAGTRGHEMAAHYVATQFELLGLRPAVNGSWYQQVPFVRYGMTGAPARLTVGDRVFTHGREVMFRQSPEEGRVALSAPLVFAGYGMEAPSLGLNDYAGLDVRGKVVVLLSGRPTGIPSDVSAHLGSERFRTAAAKGAVGVIVVATRADAERQPWTQVIAHPSGPGLTWVDREGRPYSNVGSLRFVATVDTPVAEALFRGAPRPLARVLDEAAREGARPRGFALRDTVRIERESANQRITSPNVLAVLPGSDPTLANEYVLLMAHLDGVGMREGGEGDRIRNGAMDNATGVATLIEVARQMTSNGNRPRRPILLAAVTAEEKGLLGASYLAKNPVVNGRVVSVVNLDMPILTYNFSDVIAFGAEHSTMGPIVQRAGARMNVALTPDPLPEQGLFTRSDHYMFVREGVPSVFLMTGFANGGQQAFTGFLQNQYHSPADDLQLPFNWEAGARFAQLNYLIASEIANADEAPRWYQGSFFGDAFASGQPRAPRAR